MQLNFIKNIIQRPLFMSAAVLTAFIVAFLSVSTVRIDQMGSNSFFIFNVIPPIFWISICVIVSLLFFMLPNLNEKRFQIVFVFSSILLIIGLRMAFPISFTSIPAFEPDTTSYMSIISSWVHNGVDFGVEKNYQHDYPLSFLIGFVFVKLGVSVDTYFRAAPFAIYALVMLLLYLIIKQIAPEKNKNYLPAVSIFLFSISSLAYWVCVHYCPDLLGSLMYFLCLYLIIKFAQTGSWTIKTGLPILIAIFLLILSHHLSTLYLIVTLFGFAISMWFFKPPQFKGGSLSFFIMAIFTYTLWFVYGSLVYPTFFNVYVYFGGSGGIPQLTVAAGWLNNAAFAVYPLFIFALFAVEFLKTVHIGNPFRFIKNLKSNLYEFRELYASNSLIVFTAGFCLVFLLFILGFGVEALFGTRILEAVCVGMYPLASQSMFNLANTKSRKKKIFLLLLIILIVVISIYRYYTQIQRRVIVSG